jgi:chemotaxis protein CheD
MNGRQRVVRLADLQIGTEGDVLVTVGLGSCVAIVLYDPVARIGGMAHVLLPSPALTRHDRNPARTPQTAVPRLLELIGERGGSPRRLTARLVGGASMFASLAPPGTVQMGDRNVVASREALSASGIPLTGESVGGDYGRSVRLMVADGTLEVSSVAHGVHTL